MFITKDLGHVSYSLGVEVIYGGDLVLCLRKYVINLSHKTDMASCKPCNVPIDPLHPLGDADAPILLDVTRYRAVVGKLLYLTVYVLIFLMLLDKLVYT